MQSQDLSGVMVFLISSIFPFFFVLLWLGVTALISKFSGYGELAERYPGQPKIPPGSRTLQTGVMRGTTRYKGVLTVGCTPKGLYLWVMFLFRFRHPPILVPWSELEVEEPRSVWLLGTTTEVTFPALPGVRLKLWRKIGEEVAAAKKQASLAGESHGALGS